MPDKVLASLRQAVIDYDAEQALLWATRAVEEGIDPLQALEALTSAIRHVGDGFGRGELWLPDLVGASDAMLAATPILEGEIARRGSERDSLGTVVIGTVHGDLHNIGKAMVSTLLTAEGFTVYDLGINITANGFLAAIQEHEADILAMSALMTTTIAQQVHVMEQLAAQGMRDRVKVMVGGGGVTQAFADSIGADGYDPTAPGAVRLAKKLMGLSGS